MKIYKLAIDPGHGGDDTGAIGGSITESEYVYDFSNNLKNHLIRVYSMFDPTIIRDRHEDPSFIERGRRSAAMNADLVLSLHVNASDDQRYHGAWCFHWPGNDLVEDIMNVYLDAVPKDLRVKVASFPAENSLLPKKKWLQRPRNVIEHHKAPCGLLELGFCTNEKDRRVLDSEAGRYGIVAAVEVMLARFRWLKEVENG